MHIPVMLTETVSRLEPKAGGSYLDCTMGDGGHSAEILRFIGPSGRLLALDRDMDAIRRTGEKLVKYPASVTIVHTNHAHAARVCDDNGFSELDGALIDTGVSSEQLDEAIRGFSFRADGPLDMRMDTSHGETAADIVNNLSAQELADIFYKLGDEPASRNIAKAIVSARTEAPIETTGALVKIIEKALGPAGKARKHHPATRTFQALRMKVNRELESLHDAVEAILPRLKIGGRLAVITFESISDRLVKQTFAKHIGQTVSLQQGGSEWKGVLPRIVKTDRHAVIPTQEEISINPRSRSAKLRVVERIK